MQISNTRLPAERKRLPLAFYRRTRAIVVRSFVDEYNEEGYQHPLAEKAMQTGTTIGRLQRNMYRKNKRMRNKNRFMALDHVQVIKDEKTGVVQKIIRHFKSLLR